MSALDLDQQPIDAGRAIELRAQRDAEAKAAEAQRRAAQADAMQQLSFQREQKAANQQDSAQTMATDATKWALSPSYSGKAFNEAPVEAQQHFIDAYGNNAAQAPKAWNDAQTAVTGVATGVPKQPPTALQLIAGSKVHVAHIPNESADDYMARVSQASTSSGDASELTDQDRERGRMIASGQTSLQQILPGRGAAAARDRLAAMRAAEEITPGISTKNFEIQQKAQKEFTGSGNGAQNKSSLNTIANHLGHLSEASDVMNGGGNQIVNEGRNWWNQKMDANSPEAKAIENYKTSSLAVGSEIAKLLKGTGPAAESEIKAWQGRFSPEQSPAQMQANIKSAMELIAGRVNALHNQYESAFGEAHGPFLTTQAQAIVRRLGRKYGFDANSIDPGYSIESGEPPPQTPQTTVLPRAAVAPTARPEIPDTAAQYLRTNPGLAPQFDAKYGTGASAKVLGK